MLRKAVPAPQVLGCAPNARKKGQKTCLDKRSLDLVFRENFGDLEADDDTKLRLLRDKNKPKCGEKEWCWTKNKYIVEQRYVPKGPHKGNKWLNTNNIDETMKQYEKRFDDFKYIGSFPIDFEVLNKIEVKEGFEPLEICKPLREILGNKKRIGIVLNLDFHNGPGTHWVAMFLDFSKDPYKSIVPPSAKNAVPIPPTGQKLTAGDVHIRDNSNASIEYFDSVGDDYKSVPKEVVKFAKRIQREAAEMDRIAAFWFNGVQHQRGDSECGVYSCTFLLRRLHGMNVQDCSRYVIDDDEVNTMRELLFRPE